MCVYTQVWGRIAGLEEDSSKISFEKFLTNMRQYQYESGEEKLRSIYVTTPIVTMVTGACTLQDILIG